MIQKSGKNRKDKNFILVLRALTELKGLMIRITSLTVLYILKRESLRCYFKRFTSCF